MAEKQLHDLNRLLTHLRDNAPAPSSNLNESTHMNTAEDINPKRSNDSSNAGILEEDHPFSAKWPEVFCNGREVYSKQFYTDFPFFEGTDPFNTAADHRPAIFNNENGNDGSQISDIDTGMSGLRLGFSDPSAQVPPFISFVNGLISLELDDLPDDDEDDLKCPICREKYREGESDEMPLELPCGHVIGRECLLAWLSTFADSRAGGHKGSCPTCRGQIPVEARMGVETAEGLGQVLRDTNYLLTGSGPLVLDREARDKWQVIRSYVDRHLAKRKVFDSDQDLRERKTSLGEQKVENFVLLVKHQIVWFVRSSGSLSLERRAQVGEQLSNALCWFEQCGLVGPYLDLKDDVYDGDDDPVMIMQAMKTELAGLPQVLVVMMERVYYLTLAR